MMPRKNEIPEGVREAVVDLYKEGKGYKVISKSLDIHLSTVRQIIYKWKRFNSVATRPRSGRPPKTEPGMLDESLHGEETWSASSDDETTEEDPMEQFFDPNFDGEKKIYAGSSVSVGALLLLLLTFILKHGLTKAASKDLLDLLNILVPGCVPKSLRFLKKHMTEYKSKTETHFYCPKCANYLGVEPGTECEVCQQSFSREGLLERAFYFLVMPLEIQLRSLLARVHTELGRHVARDGCISDVGTGSESRRERQSDSITLAFKCDGFPLLRSSRSSVWTVMCTVSELPYVERCRNVLLHTLWFGRGKPQIQNLLTPFINEFHQLSGDGFRWADGTGTERHTRVTARICVCDPATMPVMQNFQPCGSEFGCGFCYHKGEVVQRGRDCARVYPLQADGCDLRHMAETEQLVELVIEHGYEQGQMGVKGPSPLLLLPSFDIIKGFVPDYMHCFCLGVVPEFVNLWFNPLHAKKPFHLTAQRLRDLDQVLAAVEPPDEVRRSPQRLAERTHWQASDWRAFGLLYSPLALRGVLPPPYYEHWMLLVSALHVLLSPSASHEELGAAELSLVRFVAQVQALYGLENCSFSCHLLTHLAEAARDWGLPWSHTAFVLQNRSRRLLQMHAAARAHIFTRFFLFEDVMRRGGAALRDAGAEVRDLFSSMTDCDVATMASGSSEHPVTLGCSSQRPLSARERSALQTDAAWRGRHQDCVTEYKCLVYNNMLVTTRDRSAACRRNNSVLETSGGFVVVESVVAMATPCGCGGEPVCSCRDPVLLCRKLLPASGPSEDQDAPPNTDLSKFLVAVRSSEEMCAVACADIAAKCFVMERESQLYVMRMPMFETH
ncbi:uncharacterized protein LOC133421839 isoform X2 [Cololabis saira]|uniref:uncharacterized protein LOC133421839 isoform X2 n=1 Tax=Cololabis saira TaxID=129043 RepID=UPI002AD23E07|nr:uncharacterized protein LOC133421839 isoform X2 [Cololabis saira]